MTVQCKSWRFFLTSKLESSRLSKMGHLLFLIKGFLIISIFCHKPKAVACNNFLIDELERGEIQEDKSYKVGWLSSTLILFGSVCCIGTGLNIKRF